MGRVTAVPGEDHDGLHGSDREDDKKKNAKAANCSDIQMNSMTPCSALTLDMTKYMLYYH